MEFIDLKGEHQLLLRVASFGQGLYSTQELWDILRTAGIQREEGKNYVEAFIKESRQTLQTQGFLRLPEEPVEGREHIWSVDPRLLHSLNDQIPHQAWARQVAFVSSKIFWSDVGYWDPRNFCLKLLLATLQHLQVGERTAAAGFVENLLYWRKNSELSFLPLAGLRLYPEILRVLLLLGEDKPFRDLGVWILDSLKVLGLRNVLPTFRFISTLPAPERSSSYFGPWTDLKVLQDFLRGDLESLIHPLGEHPTPLVRGCRALALFLAGREEEGRKALEPLFTPGEAKAGPLPFAGFSLYPLQALWFLAREWAPLSKFQGWYREHYQAYSDLGTQVRAMIRHRGKSAGFEAYQEEVRTFTPGNLFFLLNAMARNFLGQPMTARFQEVLQEAWTLFHQDGLDWATAEVGFLMENYGLTGPWQEDLAEVRRRTGIKQTFSSLLSQERLWELKLEKLGALKLGSRISAQEEPVQEVICWLVDPEGISLKAVSRKPLRSGRWSAPKEVSLRTLSKKNHPALRDEDRALLDHLKEDPWGWDWDYPGAFQALAGHPRVFLETDPERPIRVVPRDIKVVAEPQGSQITFRLSEDPLAKGTMERVDADTWEVVRVLPEILKVAEVVGRGFTVPEEGRKKAAEIVGTLAQGVPVESSLLKENEKVRRVEADSRLVVQLVPDGPALVLSLHVRPLGPEGPLGIPGDGVREVHRPLKGEVLLTERDLKKEKSQTRAVLEACPTLREELLGERKVRIQDPETALEILSELRGVGDAVWLEWPQGETLKLRTRATRGNSTLQVARKTDWFELEGGLTLEDGTVMEMKDLLDLLPKARGRFLPVGDQEFLEIEAQLLKQLDQIWRISEPRAKVLRLGPAALLVSGLLQDSGTVKSADAATESLRHRFLEAFGKTHALPRGLTAELRPYQEEGYQWLCRLAEAGAGACLADDMGLGKTVQTIALLSHRRSLGPSLVVAPASVAGNWIEEILRFTTDLEPVLLAPVDRDARAGQLADLGPGKVLVVTYGLMVSEEERLGEREWNVLVLDEAQALKNVQAKRTRTVNALKADFRVALTGTPLQNHLGELWSLFDILNPGLLGSAKNYRDRFMVPLETEGDEGARTALKQIIRPFMLRRTKNQVLSDLPPKTEISLHLELGAGEAAWYGALQLKAQEEMSRWKDMIKEGRQGENQAQMQILAWMMKLRRACCHPSLTGGSPELPSVKQEKLLELLGEMGENGHRALVFSQFTDHLHLIRSRLEAAGIPYEYLDGSTPLKERATRVSRFQTGDMPVFLISLGAGGTGLNLTGADYVIHMDPWWNPAIEDQASDRAHRIGQTRPVTVYRLVAAGTIEEKIMELHRKKRGLADALLEGSEAAARLGAEDLLDILQA